MIEIGGYPVSHDKNGTGGGTTIINGGGNGSIPADLNVTSITAATGTINGLSGISLNYNDAKFMYLAAGDGQINKLRGDEINYALGKIDKLYSSDIESSTIKTEELKATKAWIEELNSKYITTEYLTVTKQAHFFELIIDKVRAVGGTLMMTQAQAVIDYAKAMKKVGSTYVEVPITSNKAQYYDVFFLAKDENNNRTITNDWVPGDQAYCQSFNNVSEGANYDVSNKYYWRLVTDILPDRYMNINTGAELPLSQAAQASVNSVFINTPTIVYNTGNPNDTEDKEGNWGWHTEAQEIAGLPQNPTWNEISGGIEEVTKGTMTTTNTILGIQLAPIEGSGLDQITPKQFIVSCNNPDTTVVEKARINIGVYYVDGSSQWFPAPDSPQETYTCNLTTQVPIESVVITNADEVEWKLVHGIRLSNKYADGECDAMLSDTSSIPSAGDNLTQLGYRWRGSSDTNEKSRGNAIIIAAYKTPDAGTGISGDRNEYAIVPPSYAQYEFIGSDSAHRFDLAHYRKTYMDGNGSKFYGDFYIRAEGPQGQQGYENISTDVAELKVEMQGIQGTVYGTQGLVEQVSYLNQQSDSISLAVQKVYGSVGIKNEFGFNTGAKSYDNDDYRTCLMWPYGYGIIGWGRLNRVCQLNIRESVDETWTISCYMKANAATRINVNFCDINAVRIYKNGEQIELPSGNWVSVGTSYDKWEFIFEHINDVNHGGSTTIGGSWGGFFDFEQYPDSINTIHVKNIVLTRGEKPNCEFAMAEEDLTYAGSGQDFTWNKGTVTLEAGTFRGYPVYRNTSYPSTGNYLDVFTYDTYTIKDHMPYTLSFWAKANVMNTYIESFMYNNDIHSIPSGVVADDNFGIDGRWRTYLSTDWQYYTVKWVPDLKTTQWPNDYVKNIIACRISYSSNSQHSGYVYLAGVTLQEGWVEGMGGTTSSLIKQTADEISLSVTNGLQSTGIDITNGKIYLQGNKVEFADSTGGHQGNIWIDPTYGTLHAVNGEFSGNVTATSGSITGQMNVASGGSIIVGEEGSYRIKIAQSSNRGYITMLDGNSNNIILMNYDTGKHAGQIKVSEADADHERYTFINPYSMESVYNYKNTSDQWNGDYSHITTQVGHRMAETEYDDLYVTGGLGARRHIKIGLGTTVSGGSEQSVVNLRAYDDNQDSAWPVCHLDTKGANWMDKGHVHVMTMWELKALLDNPDGIYNSHMANYAVMLTRINGN